MRILFYSIQYRPWEKELEKTVIVTLDFLKKKKLYDIINHCLILIKLYGNSYNYTKMSLNFLTL